MSSGDKLARIMEQLEDRVLFDAVPDGGFIMQPDAGDQAAALEPALQMSVNAAQADELPRELIILDGNVENADDMIAEILEQRSGTSLEIRMLEIDQDGVAQISEILESSDGRYDAIHILSHGSDGNLRLGNTVLSASSLDAYSAQFVTWADHMSEDADLLIYGCNFAGDADGETMLKALGALTGADVAASNDMTGSESLGGDWDLEIAHGDIETESLVFEQWFGLLADFTMGTLTGVDIGPATDTTSPTNWTHATGTGTYTNLVNEDGVNSGLSLTISTTGSLININSDPLASTIPNHTNDLSGLDGSLYDNSGGTEQITLRWSNLTPGQEYVVFSFAHASFNSQQTVEVIGGSGTVTATDQFFAANELQINGTIGNSSVDLEDLGVVMTADSNGRITIRMTSNYWAVVSGTAIAAVSDVPPDATADVNVVVEDSAQNPVTGNVLANDSALSGGLTVSAVNGSASNVGTTISGNHGTLLLNSDGSYTYTLNDSDPAVQALNDQTNLVYIGSDDGSGVGTSTSGRIQALNLNTGTTSVVTTSTLVPYINGLAANADNNLVYYSDDTSVYYWDPATDTHGVVGTLSGMGIPSSEGVLSGGATYFDGALYLGTEPDGAGSMVDIYRLDLAADGLSVTSATALNVAGAAAAAGFPDVGGFGDLIYSGGKIYGSTTVAGFWSFDLSTNAFTQINANYLGQLAATEDGRVFSAAGFSVQQVDLDTGEVTGAILASPLEALDASGAISAPQNPNSVLTERFTYTVVDDDGDAVVSHLDITITGSNDPPVANDLSMVVQQDSSGNSVIITLPSDADDATSDLTISFSAVPNATQGTFFLAGTPITTATTISGDQLNQLTFTPASGYAGFAVLNYTVTDTRGATDTGVINVTVNGPPTATNNSGSVTENTSPTATGNVISDDDGSGIDSDPFGGVLTVSAINGSSGNVGAAFNTVFGSLQVNSDGSYTYTLDDGNATVNALPIGGSLSESFSYTISDGAGGSATATLTINITGTNDVPVVASAIPTQTSDDGDVVSLNIAGHFSDPESGTLTFSATGLPPGLSIDTAGLISGSISANASLSGPYTATVTATDPLGASTNHQFTWNVNNPTPTATDNDLATTENAPLSGNVITDNDGNGVDSDPDGDNLVVSAVNGSAGNVGSSVTGTNGGAFNISSTGAYTFNPGSDFDSLATGVTATTSVTYTISDGQGGTSLATVTVTVTG
ncbi:DUF4347 domain-containing protein, partial [Stieleria varia]